MGKQNLEVFYRPNDKITIKAEISDADGLFETIGPLQELMDAASHCGKCGCKNIRFIHRKSGSYDYYELACSDTIKCRAKLSLGRDQETKNLFPRRYAVEKNTEDKVVPKLDENGKKVYLPNNGWVSWNNKLNGGKGGYE